MPQLLKGHSKRAALTEVIRNLHKSSIETKMQSRLKDITPALHLIAPKFRQYRPLVSGNTGCTRVDVDSVVTVTVW
jgi:hypothetical protein